MKKNILKGTFLAAFIAMAASANAQVNQITVDDVIITKPGTATVTVNMSTESTSLGNMECMIKFPAGYTIAAKSTKDQQNKDINKSYDGNCELVDEHLDGDFTVSITNKFKSKVSVGFKIILTANSDEDMLAETSGPIVTFEVEATEDAVEGDIVISDVVMADQGGNDYAITESPNATVSFGGDVPKFEATIASSGRTVAFCADKALDFTSLDGVTAWVVAKFTAAQSWLVPVEKVPAMTAVVLEGPAGKVEIPTTDEAVEAPEVNLLQPVTEAFTVSEEQYGKIWVMSGGKFKKAAKGLNIPVGKAYVELDAATAKLIGDELEIAYGEPTGIETINAQLDDNAPIYNLNGVRVNKLQKGVYIQNGHKFIVK